MKASGIQPALSEHFAKMSVVCSFLVVFVHSEWNETGISRLLSYAVSWGLCSIAVPFFFMASGYFLAGHIDEPNYYSRALKSRVKTLLIPFVVWHILFFITHYIGFFVKGDAVVKFDVLSCCTWFGLDPFNHPGLTPFWYIRALLILVLLTPVVLGLLRMLGRGYFYVLFPVYLLVLGTFDHANVWRRVFYGPLSLTGFFYYGLGMFARMRGLTLKSFSRLKIPCLILGVAAIICGTMAKYFGAFAVQDIAWILGIPPLMFICWEMVGRLKMPVWLMKCSFGVFAMHMFVLQVLHRMPLPGNFVGYLGRGLITCVCSVALTVALKKSLPRVMNFLCGGRC